MSDFYKREPSWIDGEPVYHSEADARIEREVAATVGNVWHCELRPFADRARLDYYAVRHELIIGLCELKARSHSTSKFPTVFLSFQKWHSLILASLCAQVPGIFIVRFTDGIRWIDVAHVDPRRVVLGGCGQRRAVQIRSAVEPVIHVPVAEMSPLIAGETHWRK